MRNPLSTLVGWVSRHRPSRFVTPYLVGALTGLVILSLVQIGETRHFADELRDGLVKGCDENGNPLRKAVQQMLRQQIKQSNPATVRRFFPQIPEAEVTRLVEAQIRSDRATIKRIRPIDCAALYP